MRFFVAGDGAVAVGLLYDGTYIAAGDVVAGGDWRPSPVMLTESAVPGTLSGGCAQVSLVFTGLSGNVVVDDVFIDPWQRG
jgi:hypothetical protein